MKPRRTPDSNQVFRLPGGTEDNDLWVRLTVDQHDDDVIESVWQPNDLERRMLAEGAHVRLVVWGRAHPPVAVGVYQGELGAPRPPEVH